MCEIKLPWNIWPLNQLGKRRKNKLLLRMPPYWFTDWAALWVTGWATKYKHGGREDVFHYQSDMLFCFDFEDFPYRLRRMARQEHGGEVYGHRLPCLHGRCTPHGGRQLAIFATDISLHSSTFSYPNSKYYSTHVFWESSICTIRCASWIFII